MRKFFFLPLLALLVSPLVSHAAGSESGNVRWRNNVYNARYGEVVVIKGGPFTFLAEVYNSLGLNNCPEAQWKALDPQVLKKDFKARSIILNGPRYFLMDRVSLTNPGAVASFQGLQLRHLADVKLSLLDVLRGQSRPYVENAVQRTTQYIFNKGRTIYQLTAPDGRTYVMQSYALIVNPKMTVQDLAGLGNHLSLPTGWKYSVRKLDADLVLKVTGIAYVIQDNFKNTYQRVMQ